VNRAIQSHPDWELASTPWPFEFQTVFQRRAATFHSLIATRAHNRPPP
jgi:hypothetical protein